MATEALRQKQGAIHQEDLATYKEAWQRFQGRSKYEVFDLFRSATLVQISTPAEHIPWYELPDHEELTSRMLQAVTDFNTDEARAIIFSWLKVTGENILGGNLHYPDKLPLVRAIERGVNLFAPSERRFHFDGSCFTDVIYPKVLEKELEGFSLKLMKPEITSNSVNKLITKYLR